MAKRVPFPPDTPKQCPCAHKHISWSIGDDYVFCWDCNRKYSLSECFGSSTAISSGDAPRNQLTLFEADVKTKNGLNNDLEKEPNDQP